MKTFESIALGIPDLLVPKSGHDLSKWAVIACDRWFQFEGSFDLLYHEADGYYYCELAGCPAPTL